MTKTKLNFRFHNPNTTEETAEYIAKVFIEVNKAKMERILQDNIEKISKSKQKKDNELTPSSY